MLNDPLFIKTQNELLHWRENKKSPRDHIPTSIKDNIRELNSNYSKAQLRSKLDLSGCSLNFLNSNKLQNKKPQNETASFVEISHKKPFAEKLKSTSTIE
ncbi:MAG: hypothetical protein H7336_13810 [Bacteriovorax sp.]|nr:hypothetical protein [Bacteriovorax sp.]